MAIVRPFAAIRPREDLAEKVCSLPYDVMNREEAATMADGNPYSFLHICRSEIDLPDQEDPYDSSVYRKAEENLSRWMEEGILAQDERSLFYIYRQTMGQVVQTGIVATVSVDEYESGVIKKHEFTRVEKEKDRIRHFDVTGANTEPVFLTYPRKKEIDSSVEKVIRETAPIYDFVTGDQVHHELWIVEQESVSQEIITAFQKVPALYIADGHHRSASACKVGLKRRRETPGYTGDEEFNYFMAVIFPDSDLAVFDYNRVVRDLNGLTEEELIKAIEDAGFQVETMGSDAYRPQRKHEFSMFLSGTWYRLVAGEEIIPTDLVASLDVAILQDHLLGPILGIEDPRTDERIDFIGGIRGLSELERRTKKDMKVAFAVHPVTIADLMAVADAGEVMPPKSTWFEPKLGSGLFLHRL